MKCINFEESNVLNNYSHLDTDSEATYCPAVMSRHHSALMKEMEKTKPSPVVVNFYLNKEFQSRRNWLRCTPAEYRCEKFFSTYPCFKDHVEVNIIHLHVSLCMQCQAFSSKACDSTHTRWHTPKSL